MPYRDYDAPGVNVIVQRQQTSSARRLTDFLPVFIGKGMTSRSRTLKLDNVTANVTLYPEVSFEWEIENHFNFQLFKETDFSLTELELQKGPDVELLTAGTDYEIIEVAQIVNSRNKVRTTIKVLDETKVTASDLLYNLSVKIENTEDDFDLRLVTKDESFYARDIFGPFELNEDGNSFLNDIAFSADIAFKMGVEKFYYLEVPREYGQEPTESDFKKALEKIYFFKDTYRIVPLTLDSEITIALSEFMTNISNPIDRREVVGFSTLDPAEILDFKDMDELIEKVGGFSETLNNERISNVFGVKSLEYRVGTKTYTLPAYFMNVAIASLDTTVGMGEPLSTREITVFSKVDCPYFRPAEWNKLAKYGVFIVHQPEKNGPIVIRHQLTTKQSDDAEYQEYSIIKNFDAVTKRIRDRMSPYAGSMNNRDGYLEKLDATFTGAVEEVKELGWAREITILQPWALRTVGVGENATENKRNLVGKFKLEPNYPANNIDIYLIV